MSGYWVRHRLLPTLVLCVAVGLVSSLLFMFPYVNQQASSYNAQSIYKNSDVDFIAPEPSFDQVQELPGTNGIDKVFPFYLTKTSVNVNGSSRTTTILLSDKFDDVDFTMYNSRRLIEKSTSEYDNPILVDWQFCHDTSSKIGDTVTFSIGGNNVEYRIYAIYETNSVYDGGAILAQISDEQKNAIQQNSNNNGYSGMYVMASDYSACKAYLTSEYRPLGRLKSRDQFEDDDQYQIHYDAIMSSGFANEITDFRVKESNLDKKISPLMVLIGAVLSLVLIIAFNVGMSKRGCERVYFQKHCIPKGQNVKPYYNTAFVFEIISFVVIYVVGIVLKTYLSNSYIPKSSYDFWLVLIPVAVIAAEIISLIMNYSVVAVITKKVKEEQKKKESDDL